MTKYRIVEETKGKETRYYPEKLVKEEGIICFIFMGKKNKWIRFVNDKYVDETAWHDIYFASEQYAREFIKDRQKEDMEPIKRIIEVE